MNTIKWTILGVLGMALSACSSLPMLNSDPHPGKQEQVGILLVQNCKQAEGCSKYSLMEPDMQNRSVILSGNIEPSLKGRLIAVLGKAVDKKNGMDMIDVEQTHSITDFDYQPFLAQAVSAYTTQQFGCRSFWDQSYAWRIDDRLPVLVANLSHPTEPNKGLRLEFDGLSKTLKSAIASPEAVNPCS